VKILIAATVVTLFATATYAGQSTRYDDLMLDTSAGATVVYSEGAQIHRPDHRPADLWLDTFGHGNHPEPVLSTRNVLSATPGFPFGGYGAGNDSR